MPQGNSEERECMLKTNVEIDYWDERKLGGGREKVLNLLLVYLKVDYIITFLCFPKRKGRMIMRKDK